MAFSNSSEPFVRPGQTLPDFLQRFWQEQINVAETEHIDHRHPPLPLARIKKVMKSDPDVKMIAADAPILLCKACEILIEELTCRAYIVADSNKRRTISRTDIGKGMTHCDQFDFLIDIVPREAHARKSNTMGQSGSSAHQTLDESHLDSPTRDEVMTELDSLLHPGAIQEQG